MTMMIVMIRMRTVMITIIVASSALPIGPNVTFEMHIRRPLLLKGGGVREGRLQVQAWLVNEHNRRFNIIIIVIIIIGVVVVAAVLILIIMMTAGDAEDAS